LHYALFEGKDDIAIFLVLYGADINAKTKGDTPLDFANKKLKKSLIDIYNEINGIIPDNTKEGSSSLNGKSKVLDKKDSSDKKLK